MGLYHFLIQLVLGIVVDPFLLIINIGGSLECNSDPAVMFGLGISLACFFFVALKYFLNSLEDSARCLRFQVIVFLEFLIGELFDLSVRVGSVMPVLKKIAGWLLE